MKEIVQLELSLSNDGEKEVSSTTMKDDDKYADNKDSYEDDVNGENDVIGIDLYIN